MVIFWFVYSCFAPGLLKSVELFSKKVLSRNQMPRSWKGIPPSSSSEWKAESFWKISWFERKQMLRVWLNVVGCGLQTCAHLLSTPGTAALLLPVPVWPQAWRQFLLFIHACISLVLAIAWSFMGDSFVCTSSVSDPPCVSVTTSGGSCPLKTSCELPSPEKVSLLLCGWN